MDGTPNPGLPDRDAARSVSPRASAPLSGNEEPTDTSHLSISPHEVRKSSVVFLSQSTRSRTLS